MRLKLTQPLLSFENCDRTCQIHLLKTRQWEAGQLGRESLGLSTCIS
jgi:hypothetical protein